LSLDTPTKHQLEKKNRTPQPPTTHHNRRFNSLLREIERTDGSANDQWTSGTYAPKQELTIVSLFSSTEKSHTTQHKKNHDPSLNNPNRTFTPRNGNECIRIPFIGIGMS
jgi:hypothetical protein